MTAASHLPAGSILSMSCWSEVYSDGTPAGAPLRSTNVRRMLGNCADENETFTSSFIAVKLVPFALNVSPSERLATTPMLDGCVPITNEGLASEESLKSG